MVILIWIVCCEYSAFPCSVSSSPVHGNTRSYVYMLYEDEILLRADSSKSSEITGNNSRGFIRGIQEEWIYLHACEELQKINNNIQTQFSILENSYHF